MKKKFADRRDATKIKMNGFDKLVYHFKPRRSDSEVYILKSIDVSNLVKYMEEKKKENDKITYFHLFSMAMAKVIYNRPYLNNFIIGGKKYHRNDVSLSFVAKTAFKDNAEEFLSVINVSKDDNISTLRDKILKSVGQIRKNISNDTNSFIESFSKLPNWLVGLIVWGARKLDNHDLLPKSLMDGNIYYSSVIISNLGSIHCGGIYHNLTNFGTNSVLCTIGEIKDDVRVINGKTEIRKVCDFGITLDERIADGFYFAKSLNLLEYILNNPSLLEDNASDKVSINRDK